jgi:hypothetical protein
MSKQIDTKDFMELLAVIKVKKKLKVVQNNCNMIISA